MHKVGTGEKILAINIAPIRYLNRGEKIMDCIDKFFKDLPNGRCHPCKHARAVVSTNQFLFLGCYYGEYNGKWVAEIKNCPNGQKEATKRMDDLIIGGTND